MNQIKKHYEHYWSERKDNFEDYARNLALPQLFKANEKVLDLGCGDGTVAAYLKNVINVNIEGIDISDNAIKEAKKKGIKASVVDAEGELPFKDQTFDAILWGDNIEHLFNPLETVQEIKRVLKNNGRLIASCPNMGYWRYRLYYLMQGRLPDTEWSGNSPWYWSHIRFFNEVLLKQFFKVAGFKKVENYIGISQRRLDQPFLKLYPGFFGMIHIIVVKK